MCICFVSDNMRDTDRGHLGMKLFTVKKINLLFTREYQYVDNEY